MTTAKSEEPESHGTSTTTPFSLIDKEDMLSMAFTEDDSSCMDGVDVLGGDADSPDTIAAWMHLQVSRLVTSVCYKRSVMAAILVCSILLGVRTYGNNWSVETRAGLDTTVKVFQVAFTGELFLSLLHFQEKLFQHGWFCFDVSVLITSWILTPTLLILRAFRLIRGLRQATGVTEVKQVVRALLRALPKMSSIALLIGMVLYIFAVLFTDFYQSLYTDRQLSEDYFGRLDLTAFTLFQIMTLDGWADIAKEVLEVYPSSWVLFLSFITTATFFLGSLVIGVMSEAVASASTERLWKSLEMRGSSTKDFDKSNTSRLEQKVEELTAMVERLARMQTSMQGSLNELVNQDSKSSSRVMPESIRSLPASAFQMH